MLSQYCEKRLLASSCLSVRISICPRGTTQLTPNGFSWNLILDYFSKNHRTVSGVMFKNTVQPDRPQMIIWHRPIACWIPKATNTNSEYVILIALPLPQWLQERASMLRYSYNACLLFVSISFCIYFFKCIHNTARYVFCLQLTMFFSSPS